MPDDPRQSPATTESGQPRKPRTKTFSGCWTCRAKHVKCDEAKPACNRCQKAGVECEGYGVRLSWAPARNQSTARRGGRRRKVAARLRQSRDSESIADTASGQDAPSCNGPDESDQGDMFANDGPSDLSSESQYTNPSFHYQPAPVNQTSFANPLNTRIFHSYEPLSQGLTTGNPYASFQPTQPQLSLLQLGQNLDQNFPSQDETNTHVTSTPVSISDASAGSLQLPGVSELVSQASSPVCTRGQGRKGKSHLDILPDPALHCELLQHWTLDLCDSLNPVPGILNPLRNSMMPIALEGARADSETSTGATALFHFICSASAFHLAKKRDNQESKRALENVALEHHNIGITHLAQNIRRSKDGPSCVSLLAAVILCIMNEAVTLPTSFWRLHFRGAVEWVNHIDPQVWHRNEAASSIYQMFRGMATVVQTQLLFDSQETSYWEFTNELGQQPEPYLLYTAFGIPQPIFEGLRAMNCFEMRRKSSSYNDPSPDELDRVELELYLSAPNKPETSLTMEHRDLIYHHGYIFYYAALIHMKRNLKDMSMVAVQPLVEKALPHLEALPSGTTQRFCPMLWPVAIIAFEIADSAMQQRMLKSFAFFEERSELAIWSQIKEQVKELWALRRREGLNIKWHQTALGRMSDSFMLL
ncbi:Arginine metabolism regulation protein II [Fusarium austroafricanum]|uniref:Arginine metabolism regulation protein II n=1 Tax=Fusarium austroafricanum TaxID=2364996 RepID=A0A8H4P3E3_9HYPO|nr:Arginine metabolism regulation protein II [Fusarium austroafricanum]